MKFAMNVLKTSWTYLSLISVHQALDRSPFIMPGIAHCAYYSGRSNPSYAPGTFTDAW